jgi:hypothetical protein
VGKNAARGVARVAFSRIVSARKKTELCFFLNYDEIIKTVRELNWNAATASSRAVIGRDII